MLKEKRKVFIKFILFYLGSLLFIVIAFITYGKASIRTNNDKDLLMIYESLNGSISQLNNLNEKYLATLKFPLTISKRDSILNEQTGLKGLIHIKLDSIRRMGGMMDTNTKASYNAVVSHFDARFKNWENINNLILSMNGAETNIIPDDATNELKLKDQRIALLESKLKTAQSMKSPIAEGSLKNQEEIKFLKWAVRSQVETIKNLEDKLKKSN